MRSFISLKSLGNAYTVADLEGFPRGLRAGCKKLEGKRDQGEEPGLVLAAHPSTVSELVRMGKTCMEPFSLLSPLGALREGSSRS